MRVSKNLAMTLMSILTAVAAMSCADMSHAQTTNKYRDQYVITTDCQFRELDSDGGISQIVNLRKVAVARKSKHANGVSGNITFIIPGDPNFTARNFTVSIKDLDAVMNNVAQCALSR